MIFQRRFAPFFSLIVLISCCNAYAKADVKYAKDQIWTYKNRSQDKGSLIKISSIERDPVIGEIYHISMIGVRYGPKNEAQSIGHLPVAKQVLDNSLLKQIRTKQKFPDSNEGIAQWREAKGGVFTISLAEIANVLDQSFKSQLPTTAE
jgi:hypothetical protein